MLSITQVSPNPEKHPRSVNVFLAIILFMGISCVKTKNTHSEMLRVEYNNAIVAATKIKIENPVLIKKKVFPPPLLPVSIPKVSAFILSCTYQDYPEKATTKYTNKVINVKGMVRKIQPGFNDGIHLYFFKTPCAPVIAVLKQSRTQWYKSIRQGMEVELACKCNGVDLKIVGLSECTSINESNK